MSSERRTRLNWRSQKKHDLQTLETCLSRLRSSANVTPSSRTWSLGLITSSPSVRDKLLQPAEARLCLEPVQTSSVLSVFSFRVGYSYHCRDGMVWVRNVSSTGYETVMRCLFLKYEKSEKYSLLGPHLPCFESCQVLRTNYNANADWLTDWLTDWGLRSRDST